MIKAIGNNFGAGEIFLQDYQNSNMIILNGEVSFDPHNQQYRDADVLEIYFPSLTLKQSSISGILMHGSSKPISYGTCVQTWVKDSNTICVEKISVWDEDYQLTLCFASAYVPKGQHKVFETTKWMRFNPVDVFGKVDMGQTFWGYTDKWVWLGIAFSELKQADINTPISFTISDMPEDVDFNGTMICCQTVLGPAGAQIMKFSIKGKVITVTTMLDEVKSMQECGFIAFIIRNN